MNSEPAQILTFRRHERCELKAALLEHACNPDAMITVETDVDGETVAHIHFRPIDEVRS